MYVYNLITCLCCVMFAVGLEDCGFNTYNHGGKTCCLCQKGYRLLSDCTDTDDTKCELCESDTYMDHPNNDKNCQPCKICDSNANMEVKEKCSRYSNTVCGCKEDYYCDKGNLCRICQPCDTCGENKVKTKCTETNNTVCDDAKVSTIPHGAIAAAVLVPILLLIIGGILFYLWKQKKDRTRKAKMVEGETTKKLIKKVDLSPYLQEIADHLGWKVMQRVAQQSGMNKASIENHECNYPNDARERTYGLLQDWFQTQGLHEAYPALIETLRAMKERRKADEIQEIVEKGQAKAQP